MSTAGLRKVGNYEETLAAAIKDEQHVAGIINPYLANAATRIINSPDFQRVKDRLEDDLSQQTRMHMDQTNYENNVTNLAVDARINRADLDYIVTNLQQPPPPPAPPPPPNDAAADRARLIAELDGLAMERERQSRQEMMAQRNAMELAAQRVATPAQEIIREFHQQPIYIPVPQVPQQTDHSEMMRQMGLTMQQIFLQQQGGYRPPAEEIPITYNNQGPPPGAPPGGGMIQRSYGPARLPRERIAPFQGGGPPAQPGGATAPMPTRNPKKPKKAREEEVEATTGGSNPPTAPAAGAARVRATKRGAGDDFGDGPMFRRFPGRGQRLPDESFPAVGRGPSASAGSLGLGGKRPPPILSVRAGYQSFSGQAQRLPSDNLRANAVQRMREIGHQGDQKRRGREMLDRQADLGRALRRGGATGDVQDLGKRKRQDIDPNPRKNPIRKMGDRPSGPQQFSIAT